MHRLAATLLVIAFVCDLVAGLGYIGLGMMGADLLAMTGALGETLMAVAGDSGQPDSFTGLAATLGGGLVAIGLVVTTAGVLALLAGVRLFRQRPGKLVYAGAASAFVTDVVASVTIGLNPFQLPGVVGGALGLYAEHALSTGTGEVGAAHAVAPKAGEAGVVVPAAAIAIGAALIAIAAYFEFLRPAVQ